ncbi:ATP-dependent Clp protease adaptor ClpS [Lentzea sp. NPDC003310]|uniref:ATP-dependent Clp protease adaptor ClpS n=1 Tax=Lentzea sp. NPDC003310 TaxID=3154447 RepID=UPI0033BE5734
MDEPGPGNPRAGRCPGHVHRATPPAGDDHVNPGDRWSVVVHNDDHTPYAVAWHLLRTIGEFETDTARTLTEMIHHNGSAGFGKYDRARAESVALKFVRAGMRATVQRALPDDGPYFTATRVGEGVLVEVPGQFARAWEPAFRMLENIYHRNVVISGLRFPRPVMTRRPFLRRMFPDVAESRWRSALLRRRHRTLLADRALVDRVRRQWLNAESLVLTTTEAGDWIVVIGQIRALHLQLRKATALQFQTLAHVQQQLVAAVDPEVVAAGPAATEQPA